MSLVTVLASSIHPLCNSYKLLRCSYLLQGLLDCRSPTARGSGVFSVEARPSWLIGVAPSWSGADRFVSAEGRLPSVVDNRFFEVASNYFFPVEDRFSVAEDCLLEVGRRWLKLLGCLRDSSSGFFVELFSSYLQAVSMGTGRSPKRE